MNKKQFAMRCDETFLKEVESLSKKESEKVGYKVSQADIVRTAIKQYSEKNK